MDLPNLHDEEVEVKSEGVNEDAEIDEIINQPDYDYIPQVETAEQRIEKTKLIIKLRRYKEIYPKKLEEFDLSRTHLDTLTYRDLELLLEEIKFVIGSRNSAEFFLKTSLTGIAVGEKLIGSYTPLKVDGLTFILSQDEDFKNTIEEIGLEYSEISSMPAHIRLMYIISKTAFMLNAQNMQKEAINASVSGKVKTDIKEKYKDL